MQIKCSTDTPPPENKVNNKCKGVVVAGRVGNEAEVAGGKK